MSEELTDKSLEVLLDKLHQGDLEAAERVYKDYAPYVRIIVRRQLSAALRARFDSADVVQSVWADLLLYFRKSVRTFQNVDHLKAFLVKAVRNRFLDRLRQHRDVLEPHHRLDPGDEDQLPSSDLPSPSEQLQAKETWQQIEALCTPTQWRVVQFKQQGLTVAEIAHQTALHPSSVRRILYELADRLAKHAARND